MPDHNSGLVESCHHQLTTSVAKHTGWWLAIIPMAQIELHSSNGTINPYCMSWTWNCITDKNKWPHGIILSHGALCQAAAMKHINNLSASSRVLFQGDSITDGGRNPQRRPKPRTYRPWAALRSWLCHDAGCGPLQLKYPGISVQQLGISGNRIVDVYARAQEHIWNHQPDLMSILIGVNDTWHQFKRSAGVSLSRFEAMYRQLLQETREHCPNIQFVLCHPFVLPCGEVGEGWREDVDQRRAIVSQFANEFDAIVVPFQDAFDAALERGDAAWWAGDGVHPTPAGHAGPDLEEHRR